MKINHNYWCGKFYDIPPHTEHDSEECYLSKVEREEKVAEAVRQRQADNDQRERLTVKIIWITTPETIQHDKDLAAYKRAMKNYEAANNKRKKDDKPVQKIRGIFVKW